MAQPPDLKAHGRRCATVEGVNIHANTYVAKQARVHLEKLCRYITRPAVCDARLKLLDDGRVRMAFKSVWSNGAVGKVFEPRAREPFGCRRRASAVALAHGGGKRRWCGGYYDRGGGSDGFGTSVSAAVGQSE